MVREGPFEETSLVGLRNKLPDREQWQTSFPCSQPGCKGSLEKVERKSEVSGNRGQGGVGSSLRAVL